MDLLELVREAMRSLRANPLRSFLTLLGIIIGVATVVGVASIIFGLDSFVQEKIITLSPDVFVVTKFGIITSRDEFIAALKRKDLTLEDYERLRGLLRKSEQVAADAGTGSAAKYGDRRLADITVHGTTANYGRLMTLDLEAGRYFLESEDRAAEAVAIIGWDIKDELFPQIDPLGRTIQLGGAPYRVIGLLAKQGRTLGQSQDNVAFVPIQTFRRSFGLRGSVDLMVKSRGGVPGVEAAADEVRAVLRAMRHTDFRDPDPFGIVTAESLQTLWRQISAGAFILTFLVSSVSLGVGGVVIMNIMLVGVVERTREIGVRLAVGARKKDIRRQFLLEATLLSLFGGVIGVSIGAAVALGIRGVLEFPARVSPQILVAGLALSAAVGIVSGYWPARNASNLLVVDALRDDA